jgi:hypothetical protein
MSEWRWLERRRTNLDERKSFLETTIENLQSRVADAENNPQVVSIYQSSLEGFQKLLEQITRIINASEGETIDEVLLDSDEAEKAITSMLKILPKKIGELQAIEVESEWQVEKERMLEALQQALDTTTKHKLKNLQSQVTESMDTIKELIFAS